MPSLWEILKTSKGLPAPDGFTALFARSLSDTYTLAEISGIPPLNLGEIVEIVDYTIYGNIYQSDGVTPDTPQEVVGSGDKTGNLINANTIVKGRLDDGVLGYENDTTELIVSDNVIKCTTAKAWRGFVTDFIPVEQGGYFLYHIATPNDVTYAYRISVYDSQKNFVRVMTKSERVVTINEGEAFIRVSFQLGVAGTFEILNIMLNSGSTPLPYEPYGYKVDVECRGKNLFDIEKWLTDNGVTYTKNEGVYTFETKYTMFTTPLYFSDTDIPITISGIIRNISATYARVTLVKADGTIAHENALTASTTVTKNITCAGLKFDWSAGGTVSFSNIMINTGTTSEPYEPYTPPITTPIYLDSPLYKIGDYADVRGMTEEVRMIRELALTGDENWYQSTSATGDAMFFYVVLSNYISTKADFCTHFKNVAVNSATTTVGFMLDTNGQLRFRTDDVSNTTLDDFKSYLKEQYNNGTPVTVYYVLAEPTAKAVDAVEIPTIQGTNIIDINTEIKPSNLKITYKSKM